MVITILVSVLVRHIRDMFVAVRGCVCVCVTTFGLLKIHVTQFVIIHKHVLGVYGFG